MEHLFLLVTIFFIIGIFAGALSGFLGLGGGTIIVPSLIYIFHLLAFPNKLIVHMAIGTAMFCNLFSMTIAARTYAKYRYIDYRLFLRFIPSLSLGAILGPQIADHIPDHQLKIAFGIILLFIAFLMLLDAKPSLNKEKLASSSKPLTLSLLTTNLLGTIIGFMASLSGLASGVFMIPLFRFCGEELRKAIGTASLTGLSISLISSVNYFFLHNPNSPTYTVGLVYLPAAITIGISSVVFANIFARIAFHVPSHLLHRAFIMVLIVIAILMLIK